MSFGENLRKARKAAGMTQIELARKTGITERSVYNYEKNSRAPKIDIVERFAQALDVPSEMLLNHFDPAEKASAFDRSIAEKLLVQLKMLFDGDLSEEEKELFFKKVALTYFERKKSGKHFLKEQEEEQYE